MIQHISNEGLDLIKSFEGCRLTAYKAVPTEQYYTIGWGHYGPEISKDTKITQFEADSLLSHDLEKYEQAVMRQKKCLSQLQFDALVSFAYNCGIGNLTKLCKKRTIHQIPDAMLLYNKAGGKVLAGLTKRRKAERTLFLKGTKSIAELAQEVLDNKWGKGKDRKSKLEAAGFDYDVIQNEVNKIIRSQG